MPRQRPNVWAWELLEALYSRGATTPLEARFRSLGKTRELNPNLSLGQIEALPRRFGAREGSKRTPTLEQMLTPKLHRGFYYMVGVPGAFSCVPRNSHVIIIIVNASRIPPAPPLLGDRPRW